MRFIALAVLCLMSPVPKFQEDVLDDYEPTIKADLWSGWKEGSWIQRKVVTKDGSGKRVAEYKITLDRIASNGYCFKIDTLDEGKVESSGLFVKLVYAGSFGVYEGDKKEDVKIGDKTFTCFVQEYKTEGDNASLQRTLECKDAPGVIVQMVNENKWDGKKTSIKQSITSLAEEKTIGGKKVACWKVEKTHESEAGPQKNTVAALFSKDVPGGLVWRESQKDYAGNKTTMIDEITAFEGKK